MPNYYHKHVFFCLNQREAGRACCANHRAKDLHAYAKEQILKLGLAGVGKIRINQSGCLGRCQEGPALVIYPDGVWYTYRNEADIDAIIQQHLLGNQLVTRLLLAPPLED